MKQRSLEIKKIGSLEAQRFRTSKLLSFILIALLALQLIGLPVFSQADDRDARANRYILSLNPVLYIPFYKYGSEQVKAWDISMGHPEKVVNGGLEDWASATDAVGWTEAIDGGTSSINRDAIAPHSGTYCARLDIDADGNFARLNQNLTLIPGNIYKLVIWYKSSVVANTAQIIFRPIGVVNYLKIDGTWGGDAGFELPDSQTYTKYEIVFTALSYSEYVISFLPYNAVSISLYFDDVSITPIQPESNGNHGTIFGATPALIPMLSPINLVSNGGMEVGNPPTGWTIELSPETYERSGIEKHSGSYSAHIIDSVPSFGGFYQYTTQIIKRYHISFWYKTILGSVICHIGAGDESGIIYLSNSLTANALTYYGEIYQQTISGAKAYIEFINESNINPAEFYVDDVSIQEVIGYQGGQGYQLDGVDDRIVHPSLNLGKSHTLHYWIVSQSTSGVIHGGATNFHGLRIDNSTGIVGYNADTTEVSVSYTDSMPLYPTLFSVIRNGTSVIFAQNGIQIGVEQTLLADNDLVLTDIGRNSDGSNYFKGVTGHVVGYTTNHTVSDAKTFFELTKHRYGR